VIAETPPQRCAGMIVALIAAAEVALLLFALAPEPLHPLCVFVNGLSLGLVSSDWYLGSWKGAR
jgi:Family of unknown function (DUF5690)